MNTKLVTGYINELFDNNDRVSVINFVLGTVEYQTQVLNDYAVRYQAVVQQQLDDITFQQQALTDEVAAIAAAIKG